MKTKYKFIYFNQIKMTDGIEWAIISNKAHVNGVVDDKHLMGGISYYTPWKQYVAEFRDGFVFNNECLLDVADFLSQLNTENTN